jgi:hypothetical protein
LELPPKRYELAKMRDCQVVIHLDLGDLSVSASSFEDKWGYVFRLSSIELRATHYNIYKRNVSNSPRCLVLLVHQILWPN